MAGYAKQHIANTFMKMLETSPLDKIKVSDLIQQSGVNRKTFYYHFHGLEDILIYILKSGTANLPLYNADFEDWDKKTDMYLHYLQKRRLLLRRIYSSSYSESMREFLKNNFHRAIIPFVYNCLESFEKNIGRSVDAKDEDLDNIAEFLTNGVWPIIDDWIKRDFPYPVKKIVKLIDNLTNHNIFNMFEAFYL